MGESAQGPTYQFAQEDRKRLFVLMSEAEEALITMAEAAITAAALDVPSFTASDTPGHATSHFEYSDIPGVVAAVVKCPTSPPTTAYVYYIDGEAVDVVWPATGAVFPH